MKKAWLIGLSLSFCIRDILRGLIEPHEVLAIFCKADINNPEVFRVYMETYWREFNPHEVQALLDTMRSKVIRVEEPDLMIPYGIWVDATFQHKWDKRTDGSHQVMTLEGIYLKEATPDKADRTWRLGCAPERVDTWNGIKPEPKPEMIGPGTKQALDELRGDRPFHARPEAPRPATGCPPHFEHRICKLNLCVEEVEQGLMDKGYHVGAYKRAVIEGGGAADLLVAYCTKSSLHHNHPASHLHVVVTRHHDNESWVSIWGPPPDEWKADVFVSNVWPGKCTALQELGREPEPKPARGPVPRYGALPVVSDADLRATTFIIDAVPDAVVRMLDKHYDLAITAMKPRAKSNEISTAVLQATHSSLDTRGLWLKLSIVPHGTAGYRTLVEMIHPDTVDIDSFRTKVWGDLWHDET